LKNKKILDNNKNGFKLSIKEILKQLNNMYSYYCSLDRNEDEEKFRIALKFAIKKVEANDC
jgi:hypothetical protein